MKTIKIQFRKKVFITLLSGFFFIMLSAFLIQQQPWKAPSSADATKNPLKSDATTIASGKKVYDKECQSCHGKKGKGDGPAAANLDIPAGNFTSVATQGQSDGALFWKISEGKKSMPSLKKKLDQDEIWQVVIYIRTFKQ